MCTRRGGPVQCGSRNGVRQTLSARPPAAA
jgi:hypothetical protein